MTDLHIQLNYFLLFIKNKTKHDATSWYIPLHYGGQTSVRQLQWRIETLTLRINILATEHV